MIMRRERGDERGDEVSEGYLVGEVGVREEQGEKFESETRPGGKRRGGEEGVEEEGRGRGGEGMGVGEGEEERGGEFGFGDGEGMHEGGEEEV